MESYKVQELFWFTGVACLTTSVRGLPHSTNLCSQAATGCEENPLRSGRNVSDWFIRSRARLRPTPTGRDLGPAGTTGVWLPPFTHLGKMAAPGSVYTCTRSLSPLCVDMLRSMSVLPWFRETLSVWVRDCGLVERKGGANTTAPG